jgi:hypothetical protein
MKNFRADVRSVKVYCRFSVANSQWKIASRKLQRPICHVQTGPEIFQGRFTTGKSVSPKSSSSF